MDAMGGDDGDYQHITLEVILESIAMLSWSETKKKNQNIQHVIIR